MSLLLDALKRAEDAKRAKAEAAATQSAPTELGTDDIATQSSASVQASVQTTPEPLGLVNDAAADVTLTSVEPTFGESHTSPPPEFPVLSLEIVDDRPDDPVAKSSSNPAASLPQEELRSTQARPKAARPPNAMTLEEMLASELGYTDEAKLAPPIATPPATAAFRASRLPPAQSPAELLASFSTSPSLEPLTAPTRSADLAAPPAQAESPQQALNREAIKNVFAVKQVASSSGKAKWMLPIAGVLLAVIGAGGWYVWNEMNRLGKPVARVPTPPSPSAAVTPAPATTAPTTSVGASVKPSEASSAATPAAPAALDSPSVPATKTATAPEEAPLPPLLPPPATQLKEERAPTAAKIVAATPREAIARRIEALPSPPNPNISNDKVMLRPAKATVLEINPALAAGYAALAAGEYVTAKQRYAEAIASNGNSADAHLGFATAAARSGNAADLSLAIKHYQRVLEIDPRNATASAALIVLAGGKDGNAPGGPSGASEKELGLKRLIDQDPSAANAHFLLGNLYAESRRWAEAQPAYFEAARLMPQNADYSYNLAVSLDQLGQGGAAVNFYRRALAASVKGQFDVAAVERRIAVLSATPAQGSAQRSANPSQP